MLVLDYCFYWIGVLVMRDGFCVNMILFCPSLKDKIKKLTVEREALESHLKNEKDEKELYKVL